MKKFRFILMIALIIAAHKGAEAQVMDFQCEAVMQNVRLQVSPGGQPDQVHVHFENGSEEALWFPFELQPAFRQDKAAGIITIWFGYFEEPYGRHKEHYMLPAMRLVGPGDRFSYEITSSSLAAILRDPGFTPRIAARIATRQLRESRTRGDQPLPDYIEHSCIIRR